MDFQDDLDHYCRVIAGLESVHEHINYNAGIDTDGTYALTVLELHAQDEGHVAGTEGFLDSIKRGATNIYEWIKKLIKTIRDWFRDRKVEREVEELDKLAKAANIGLTGADVRRMGVLKFILKVRAARRAELAGNERISIDTVTEEIEKMSPEEQKQVEVYLAEILDSAEYKEAVKEDHDFAVNKAIAVIKPRITELNSLLEQMKEADPNGEGAKALGINPGSAFSQFSDILTKIDHVSSATLTDITGRIGRGVVDGARLLKSATDKLDSLNKPDATSPVVTIAARIVKLLGTFVEIGRKLVAQLTVVMEKGEYNAASVFISRRWFEARTKFAAIK